MSAIPNSSGSDRRWYTPASSNVTPSPATLIPFPTPSEKKKTRAERHQTPQTPTAAAITALNRYLAMGPARSLKRLAAELHPDRNVETTKSTLADWSRTYNWRAAAIEHDRAEIDQLERERLEPLRRQDAAQEEMDDRQAERAAKLQDQLFLHMEILLALDAKEIHEAQLQNRRVGTLYFGPRLLLQALVKMIQLERIARGVPTTVIPTTSTRHCHENTWQSRGIVEVEDARKKLTDLMAGAMGNGKQ